MITHTHPSMCQAQGTHKKTNTHNSKPFRGQAAGNSSSPALQHHRLGAGRKETRNVHVVGTNSGSGTEKQVLAYPIPLHPTPNNNNNNNKNNNNRYIKNNKKIRVSFKDSK